MTVAATQIRRNMLMTTALASAALVPATAQAQNFIEQSDIVSVEDANGNPTGAQNVIKKQFLEVERSGSAVTLTVKKDVVVSNWLDFNVPVNTTLDIVPTKNLKEASLLARVILGGNPSDISGAIRADKVNFWLINQNGILFGNNASVSANSFFASTLNVNTRDFWDFYKGTDNFGNGAETVQFAGSNKAITAAASSSAVPTFVTDGTLMFVSQQLDIEASMSAGGRLAFVAATNVDVEFTPGSPLKYTVAAGTTVAGPQRIAAKKKVGPNGVTDGTLTGDSVEFAIITSAAAVNSILTVTGDVSATGAIPSRTGISLFSSGAVSPAAARFDGDLRTAGSGVVLSAPERLTINGNIKASDVTLNTKGALVAGIINASRALDIGNLQAPSSVVLNGNARGSRIDIRTSGAFNGQALTATSGAVDLDAASVRAGNVRGTSAVDIDAAGNIALDSAIAENGALRIGVANTPASLTVIGASRGTLVDLQADGAIRLGDVTATAGRVDIDSSNGLIDAAAVSATGGNALLTAVGRVTTDSIFSTNAIDVDSSGGGTLDLGELTAGTAVALDTSGNVLTDAISAGSALMIGAAGQTNSVALSGSASARSVVIDTANTLAAQAITATGGLINLDAGRITAGALRATGNIEVDAGGTVTLGGAIADSDNNGAGNLAIGSSTTPSKLTVSGAASGVAVDLQSVGNLSLGKVSSTGGVIDLDSTTGTLTAGVVSAVGGDALLTAQSGVATTSISATGGVDVDSLGGGALALGNLSAGGNIALDTSGTLSAGSVNAGGQLLVGLTADPSSVTFSGNAVAASIDIDSTGALSARNLRATSGLIDIDTASITAGAVRAATGVSLDAAGGISLASIRADSDGNGTGAVNIGVSAVPSSLTVTGATSGTAVDIQTAGTATLGDIAATVGAINLDAGGAFSAGALFAGTNIVIGAATPPTSVTLAGNARGNNVTITTPGAIAAADITARAGSVLLDAGTGTAGSITAGTVRATGNITARGNGSASFTSLRADSEGNGIGTVLVGLGRTPASLTVTGDTSGAGVSLSALGDVVLGAVLARNSTVAISSTSGGITAGKVRGAGLVTLVSQDGIATASIRSVSGAVDVDSTGGGDLALGDVMAAAGVTLDTSGALEAGKVTAGGALLIGALNDPASILLGNARAKSIDIDTTGAFAGGDLTATGGAIAIDALSIAARDVTATGSVNLTATGGDAIFAGDLSGSTVDVFAAGDFASRDVTATAGAIDIDAASARAGALSAANGITVDTVDPAGVVSLASATAGAGALAVTAGELTIIGASSGTSVDLLSNAAATLGNVTSTAGAVDIDSISGGITASVVSATGGNAELTADGAIRTASITASASIDVDSTGGGTLNLGNLDANGGSIALDTTGNVRAGTVDSTGALTVGALAASGSVEFTGNAQAASMAIDATGSVTTANLSSAGDITIDAGSNIEVGAVNAQDLELLSDASLTTRGAVVATGTGLFEAGNIDLQSTVAVNGSSFVIRAIPGRSVGLGAVSGGLNLSDAELDRITTPNLVIDAGDQAIVIDTVSFADGTGSTSVVLATTGELAIVGDVTGNGAARTFRFGGNAAGDTGSLASRISANIVLATIDFGDAALDLRGNEILFGQQRFINALAGRDPGEVAALFVGNAGSALYNPLIFGTLGAKREADPVYLKAGSLKVTYGDNALFQNTSLAQQSSTDYTGIALGAAGNTGVLSLSPIDASNAFAFFGEINGLDGVNASLAGPAVIVINGNVDPGGSRVNGCIIGSGAGCLTTIIGATALEIPRENLSVLSGDDGLLVPFDPLVGTNNEGLFSDAAANPQPACEPDATGECPAEEGGQ